MKRPSFLALPRPIVTCILRESTVDRDIATIRNGEFDGAAAFAIHLEPLGLCNLTDEVLTRLISATSRPVMLLHYRTPDTPVSDEARVEMLLRGVACGAAAVDLTADTFDPSPLEFSENPEAVRRQRDAIDQIHRMGGEVVMSSHIYEPRSRHQVVEHLKKVADRGADFAKIVTLADTEEDFTEAVGTTMALRRELTTPFIHLVGGKFALPHRYLSPSLGNSLTFCVHEYTENFLPAVQPPVRNMLNILQNYNWHIDR